MRIKCNYNGEAKVVTLNELEDSLLLSDLLVTLKESFPTVQTALDTNSVIIEFDYPKKVLPVLENIDKSLSELGFKNGQQLWIKSSQTERKRALGSNSPPEIKKNNDFDDKNKENDSKHKKSKFDNDKEYFINLGHGRCKVKKMKDDNSCLFHAISFNLFNDANQDLSLRDTIQQEILKDEKKYSELYLGKTREKYMEWISKRDTWGGAIEIDILANYFGIVIYSYDIKNERIDKFSPNNGSLADDDNGDDSDDEDNEIPKDATQEDKLDKVKDLDNKRFMILLYNGVHYDCLVYEDYTASEEIGTFSGHDYLGKEMLKTMETLGKELKISGYYVDMSSINVICKQCNLLIQGESNLTEHMKSTNHYDFEEVG